MKGKEGADHGDFPVAIARVTPALSPSARAAYFT